ncbi:MAG: bifunctional 4-hydroxy-2-oxoglutarate aldolase/2-dehydro-3-deoxy-phosphogluconate aldolase [Clostridia bacterium]|nr:bifunctional 4-hydroxy-2-oxoglutarate aldolase/2-dehydro-3-deoxy-phosphogluconate aldolase [Clostridia bacterium]
MDVLKELSLIGIVPVIAINDAADAVPLAQALCEGGLPCAEVTFRTAAAEEAIRNMTQAYPDMLVGAGTVLTNDQVDRAVAAGAKFIVSPGLNPTTVKHCQEIGIPVCPGTANPSDIETALSLGLKTVKFFPAEAAGGLKYIKSIAAPYVDVTFMPTGGIGEKNLLDYLSFKKIICVGGSWMVPGDALAAKDWDRIRNLVSSAVSLMLGLEIAHVGINSADEAEAMETATKLCKLFGWPIKVGNSSIFAGTAVEVMKKPFRGAKGHIGIKTNFVDRAKAYLERQGFEFDESSASYKEGRLNAIYLKDEIAGFAFHIVQKS